jgi:peptidoglycan/xylan/chitin deacetylase (PgdA/CDA1 family)
MTWPCAVTVDLESEWGTGATRAVDLHLPGLLERLAARGAPATFFCSGEIVRLRPDLLRSIPGPHELASHGLTHRPLHRLPPDQLRAELADSRAALEQALGRPCLGFRAPYFSADSRVLEEVARAGYAYDSSVASFGLHIGYANLLRPKRPERLPGGLVELPVPDATPARIPFGLSYYWLFYPLSRLFHLHRPHLLYLHCDEFLPERPGASLPPLARACMARNRGARARELLERLLDALQGGGAEFVTAAELARRVDSAG